MTNIENNSWSQWGVYVIKELERLNKCNDELNRDFDALKITYTGDITNLKFKSGLWGAIAGFVTAIPTVIAIIAIIVKFMGV